MKTTVSLSGVPETMLIPMYARAVESRKEHRVIDDQAAVEMVDRLDYDFSKFDKGKMSLWGCVARTIIFDRELKKYIANHPECVCINIGCGLDTRFRRVDNGKIVWCNLDLPSVIDLRKELLPDQEREISIAESVFDDTWVDKVPKKQNTVFIIEGVLMYFTEEQVKNLFSMIRKHFPNATVFAELSSTVMVKNQKKHDVLNETSAKFHWGIKYSKDVEAICPFMKLTGEWNLTPEMRRFTLAATIMMPFQSFNNRIARFQIMS
jgi:O-methyltransferase involved in polyketide biosynthesis